MAKNNSLPDSNSAVKWRLLLTVMLVAVTVAMTSACSSATDTARSKPKKSTPSPSATTLLYDPVPLLAKVLVEKMPLEDKVAQMFMVTPEALLHRSQKVVAAGEPAQQAFERRPVGGVILNTANLQSPEQVKTMSSELQEYSQVRVGIPLFIAVDEEGGTVARVSGNSAMGIKPYPNMREVGARKDPKRALEIGTEMGEYLANLGFNIDFAPDVDVLTNSKNDLLKDRAFGSDARTVTKMAAAFSKGLQTSGVLATYKHFPGHGSTSTDTHKEVTISQRNARQLERVDLVPFKDAVANNIKVVMVSHVSFPKVVGNDTPASLSKKLVTGWAREKLKYQGILITDSMRMGAISNNYQPAEAAVMAVAAGNDIVLDPQDFEAAYQGVLAALNSGQISEDQINQSVSRIVATKLRLASADDRSNSR